MRRMTSCWTAVRLTPHTEPGVAPHFQVQARGSQVVKLRHHAPPLRGPTLWFILAPCQPPQEENITLSIPRRLRDGRAARHETCQIPGGTQDLCTQLVQKPYPMLRKNASGPDIGLPGAKIRPGSPTSGPEALLRSIGYTVTRHLVMALPTTC